jgi:hypothetical protein
VNTLDSPPHYLLEKYQVPTAKRCSMIKALALVMVMVVGGCNLGHNYANNYKYNAMTKGGLGLLGAIFPSLKGSLKREREYAGFQDGWICRLAIDPKEPKWDTPFLEERPEIAREVRYRNLTIEGCLSHLGRT